MVWKGLTLWTHYASAVDIINNSKNNISRINFKKRKFGIINNNDEFSFFEVDPINIIFCMIKINNFWRELTDVTKLVQLVHCKALCNQLMGCSFAW